MPRRAPGAVVRSNPENEVTLKNAAPMFALSLLLLSACGGKELADGQEDCLLYTSRCV